MSDTPLRRGAAQLQAAAQALAELHPGYLYDLADRFTCQEAEAIAVLAAAVYDDDVAFHFLAAHAAGDEEGDLHWATRSVPTVEYSSEPAPAPTQWEDATNGPRPPDWPTPHTGTSAAGPTP